MEDLELLYDTIVDNNLYSKSFDEFKVRYEDEDYQENVWKVVSENDLYSKSFQEFQDKYNLGSTMVDSSELIAETVPEEKVEVKENIKVENFDNIEEEKLVPKLKEMYGDTFNIKEQLTKSGYKYDQIYIENKVTGEGTSIRLNTDYNKERGQANENAYSDFISFVDKKTEEKQPGFIEDKLARLARGITNTTKGVKEFGIATTIEAMNLFYDFGDDVQSEKQKTDVLRGVKGVLDYSMGVKPLEEFSEALGNNIKEYETENITDDIAKAVSTGDLSAAAQAGERIIGGILESSPSLVLAALGPGGLITLGASSAGNKFDEEFEENPEEGVNTLFLNSLLTGTAEASFELVTRGILSRAGNLIKTGNKQAADELIKSYSTNLFKRFAADPAREGVSEAATEFTIDLIDLATLESAGEISDAIPFKSDFYEKNWRKWVDAGLIGYGTGAGVVATGALTSNKQSVKNAAEYTLTPEADKQALNDAALNINNLNQQLKQATDQQDINVLEFQLANQENNILNIKKKVSQELNMMKPDELKTYAENIDRIKKIKKAVNSKFPSVRKPSMQELDNLQRENETLIRESVDRRIKETTQAVNVEEIGRTVNTYNDTESFQKAFDNTEDGKKSSLNVESADGFIDSEGNIFVNKTVAQNVGNVNVAAHELLHGIIKNNIQEPGQLNKLVDEFKATLPKDQLEKIQKRIDDNYRYERDEQGEVVRELKKEEYNEEYFTAFADLIGNRQIKFNENIFTKIGDFLTPIFTKKGYGNIKFKTGKDVYDFIKNYQKEVGRGELSPETIEAAKKVTEEDIKTEFSKTQEDIKIKEIFDKFTGPAENRRFKSKEEFKKSPEYFDALLEIEQSNTLDASIRNTVGEAYLNMNPGFVKQVKERISDKYQSEYDASKNSLFGWLMGKNISGQPLINLASGDIQTKISKQPRTVTTTKKVGGEDSKTTIAETLVSDEISPEKYTDIKLAQDKLKKIKPQQSAIAKKLDLTENEINLAKRDVIGFLRKSDRPAMTDAKKFFKALVDYTTGKDVQPGGFAKVIYDKLSLPKDGRLSTKNREAFIRDVAEDLIALNKVDPAVMRRSKWTPFYELEIKNMNPTQTQKAIDEGRVPSTTNLKSGLDLFKTLDPSVDEVVDYLMGIRPDVLKRKMPKFLGEVVVKNEFNEIVENPKQPVYDSKGNKTDNTIDLSESITEEEVVRGAPQVREKIARPQGVKFSVSKVKNELEKINKSKNKEKKSGKEELDAIVDAQGLANIRGNVDDLRSVMLMVADKAKKFVLDGINKILMPGNLTSGNRVDLLKRFGFNVISNPEKIKDAKLKKEAYEAIERGEFLDLSSVLKEVTKGVEKIKNENVDAIKIALGAKSGEAAKKNASRKKQHDKGVKLTTDLELDIFLESAEGEAFIRLIGHNDKLNKNGSRNQALPNSVEVGATVNGKRRSETTDEHQWQANEWVKGKLKLFKNIKNNLETKQEKIARKALDLYLDFSKDNYTQFLLKNETDIIKGDLVNDKGKVWKRSDRTLHPVFKEKLNNFIELASKKGTTEEQLQKAFNEIPSADIRYFSDYGYVNPNFIRTYKADGSYTTKAEEYNVVVPNKFKNDPNVIIQQGKIIESIILTEAGILTGANAVTKADAKQLINENLKIASSQLKASKSTNKTLNDSKVLDVESNLNIEDLLNKAASIDEALNVARDVNAPVKKIRVFDFDDTLATTKSNVLYTKPDGTEGELTAEQFARDGARLLEEGYVFDFSEFNKVTKGKPGPLLDIAKKIQAARGTEDVFVLTARAPESAVAIKEFLDTQGLNIPLENITGLGNSTGVAKANWIVDKAAKGYNDFYFADDAYQNVKAVKDALSVIDVKSKVQQAKFSLSKDLNSDFNKILENKSGIGAEKVYSDARAKTVGASKGKFKFFIPPSAEDFVGLLYPTLAKGKLGDQQMAWYKERLLNPFARAMENLSTARVNLMQDFKALKKELDVPKDLRKEAIDGFTNEQAVRVYLWNEQGMDIPGISKRDLKELTNVINNDPKLKVFADQLKAINKMDGYPAPNQTWLVGTITTDLINGLNTVKRTKYLEEWQTNADIIFSKENLNKMEAIYGPKYREAMENMLSRMKTGKNRLFSESRIGNQVLDYINGSIGAIMFFNTRSAVLQTISSINFINWSDNNIYKAGKAFANQKQYWKDFTTLMNSDFLKDRRQGLKLNISESEIADAAQTSKNKAKAAINYLLQKGFLPTQIADSFAIASGGATFYRNKINSLMKEGMSQKEAEAEAYVQFREVAEESQQSSRADRISQQQASNFGRIILAFANTPSQYARIIKKSVSDLKNKRGDWRNNVSKIVYYGAMQNLIFNVLQQALFAIGFGDDDEEKETREKKYISVGNGMADSLLRGLGIGGAAVSVAKNLLLDLYERSQRKRPEYVDSAWKLLDFSPPIDSKISKLKQAGYMVDKYKDDMIDKGFAIDNPAYEAAAKVISATTNIPVDRLFSKIKNIEAALGEDAETWQRVAMMLGWPEWQIKPQERKSSKPKTKEQKAKLKLDRDNTNYKAAQSSSDYDVLKKLNKAQQVKMLKELGYGNRSISKARKEDDRIKLIQKVRKEQ